MEDLVKLVVAKQYANAARFKVFGLKRNPQTNWELLRYKTMVLKAVSLGACYLTTTQKDYMLRSIINLNLD